MLNPDYRNPTMPARPPHVLERHPMVELLRPIILQTAANFRFTAAQLEFMIYQTPDRDEDIDEWVLNLERNWKTMAQAMIAYRNVRDIEGTA